jgi:hypothetical protein
MKSTSQKDQLPPKPDWELITPEIAADLLKKNISNRKFRQSWANYYIRQIQDGSWRLSHHGICIGEAGCLVDGQHRLHAMVATNTSFWLLVARWPNVSNALQLGVDQGAKRSNADLLQIPKDHAALAACIARLSIDRSNQVPSPDGVGRVYFQHFKKEIDLLYDVCNTKRKGSSSASVGVGAVVNMKRFPSAAAEIVEQYRKLVLVEEGRWPSIVSLCRSCRDEGGLGKDSLVAKSYLAFNPDRRGVEKLIVRDQPKLLAEIREYLRVELGITGEARS